MKIQHTLALIVLTTSSSFAVESNHPDLSKWKAGTAAIHTKVRDQGDMGFCWANAWASYLESKVLIEKNKELRLSEMFVARNHMAREYIETLDKMNSDQNQEITDSSGKGISVLSRYQLLKKNPIELNATKQFLTRKFQDYSAEDLEGYHFTDAHFLGVIPSSIYEKENDLNIHLGPKAGNFPPYVNRYYSPRNSVLFNQFIANRLMDDQTMTRYLSDEGIIELERDFDRDTGRTPISEFDTFSFEGKQYSAHSFLTDYVGFDATQFIMPTRTIKGLNFNSETGGFEITYEPMPISKSGYVTDDNFDEAVSAIQKELDQRRPTLLSMLLLDDVENHEDLINIGVMDPSYCEKAGDCRSLGGHAVLIVNSLKDENGSVKAFIIQNSWGPEGTTENAVQTKVRADRGFHIVTMDYLKAAKKHRGFLFKYMLI